MNYPKSSCDCFSCSKNIYNVNVNNGIPTNLGVTNCYISKYFDCYNKVPFKQAIEPTDKCGFDIINPQLMLENYATDFQKVNCNKEEEKKLCNTGCCYSNKKECNNNCNPNCNTVFISTDPRLIDVPRAQITPLDAPPFSGEIPLSEINDNPILNRFGKDYRTYSDINAGQITYYTNRATEDAFFNPNFVSSANMVGTIYQDPMGAIKPQYERFPLKCNNPLNTSNTNYQYCLSSIDDSTEHRQDLMARQMRKMNEQRWAPRWTPNC